jgi:hypothetical protein
MQPSTSATPNSETTTPKPPGGPGDAGFPVIISEKGSALAHFAIQSTMLYRRASDLEHASDPETGRNFHWDAAANGWINSQTGEKANFAGYLSSTPESPTTATLPTATQPASTASPSSSQTSMSTTSAGVQFQLRGFGGASFINGNSPGTAGLDGAVLFPIGNKILIGPTAGFQWINKATVDKIGGGGPGSTFINTSVGINAGNFTGRVDVPLGRVYVGIQGGVTVAGATITKEEGFTSPTGGTTASTTTDHQSVVGPNAGVYLGFDPGWSKYEVVGTARWFTASVFAEYDYSKIKVTAASSGSSGGSKSSLDLQYNTVVAGIRFTFGHQAK